MPAPIFVLGCNRSGTTWLSNILCNHKTIAGVQHDIHHGIHESSFFSHILDRYGSLNNDNNYIELVETFSRSDYFVLTGISKDVFYNNFKNRPRDYYSFFRKIMDMYAHIKKCSYWLEKTPMHTPYINTLMINYPDAKIITIKRNIISTLNSFLKLLYNQNEKLTRKKTIAHLVLRYVTYYKYINHYSKKSSRILQTTYEDLTNNTHTQLQKICDFLNVEYNDKLLVNSFKPNSSFDKNSSEQNARFLTCFEIIIIYFFYYCLNTIPFVVFQIHNKLNKRNKNELPWYHYKLLLNNLYLEKE